MSEADGKKVSNASLHGKAALDRLYRGFRNAGTGLVFLDFDDVICINKPYGGYDLFQAVDVQPADLFDRLWHQPSVEVLLSVLKEFNPRVILTTSWLRLMERPGFEALFQKTGLAAVTDALHERWEAPAMRGDTRARAIERWLHANYRGEPLVVVDDVLSGTGLRGSKLDRAGCVLLCEEGVGLHAGHLPFVRQALSGVHQ